MRRAKVGAVDSATKKNRQAMGATIIGPREEMIAKAKTDPMESGTLPSDGKVGVLSKEKLIQPPYDKLVFAQLPENNTELFQCVQAMEINIEAFGGRLVPVKLPEEIAKTKEKAIKAERKEMRSLILSLNPDMDLTTLRRRTRVDIETTGEGYWELVPTRSDPDKVAAINHVESHTVVLTPQDEKFVAVKKRVIDLETGDIVEKEHLKRFRRFIQSRNAKVIFFKEWGDTRVLSRRSGKFYATVEDAKKAEDGFKDQDVATSLMHFRIYSPRTPYGLPRFTGNLFSIFGSRAAEEINWNTFQNNNVPSMAVLVSGNAMLTEPTIKRIEEFTEYVTKRDKNFSKFLILESEPATEGLPNSGTAKVEIIPLANVQHKDQLFQEYDKNNADKVRRAFRLPPIFVGRCHSADTEYLTSTGWKTYDAVLETDLLATLNAATGGIEFQGPSARHVYDYDGELLHLQNRGIDALVTPNHRMWTRATVPSTRVEKPWAFIEAGQLTELRGGISGHLELPVSAAWDGKRIDSFTMPRNDGAASWNPDKFSKNITRDVKRYEARKSWDVSGDTFLRFLGYFISEGSTTVAPGPITLSQNVGDIAEDMIKTLRELGFDPTIVESREGQLNISICHGGLWAWLRENCGEGSASKRMPEFVLQASMDQLQILLNAMIDGDGHRPSLGSEGSFSYTTISRRLNDQLHELCLKLGIALTTRLDDRSSMGWSNTYNSYGHHDRKHLLHPEKHITPVAYKGKVACFTVPNGLLVTRYNGRVLISGNSDDYSKATAESSRRLADEQVFAPERNEMDRRINDLFRDLGWVYWEYKSFGANVTDDQDLVSILNGTEKTGALTPNLAREVMSDILNKDLEPYDEEEAGFDPNIPFSLTMAEAVKGIGALGGHPNTGVLAPNQGQVPAMRGEVPRGLDGKPIPGVKPMPLPGSGEAAGAQAAIAAGVVLNGAQMQALVQIVKDISNGQLPMETAVQVLIMGLGFDRASAEAMLNPALDFTPTILDTPPPAAPPEVGRAMKSTSPPHGSDIEVVKLWEERLGAYARGRVPDA